MLMRWGHVLPCLMIQMLMSFCLNGQDASIVQRKDLSGESSASVENLIPKNRNENAEVSLGHKLSFVENARLKDLGIDPTQVDLKTIKKMDIFKMATPDEDADGSVSGKCGQSLKKRLRFPVGFSVGHVCCSAFYFGKGLRL